MRNWFQSVINVVHESFVGGPKRDRERERERESSWIVNETVASAYILWDEEKERKKERKK